MRHDEVYTIERILSAGTYLTAGGVGFVWLIIAAFMRKHVTPFLMYHILQSIFISICFFLLSIIGQMLYVILYRIPIINAIPYFLNLPLFSFNVNLYLYSFVFGLSILQIITTSIILYLAITSAMGYYSYIPWVSDVIKGNTGRG